MVISGAFGGRRAAMINEHEIRERLVSYLDEKESVNDFANWLSRESTSIRFDDDAEFDLAASIQNNLEVYFDGIMDEPSLRNELRSIVESKVQEHEAQFVFDDLPASSLKPDVKRSVNSSVQVASFAL
jgi:hypothetical protein